MRIRNVDSKNDWTFGQSLTNYLTEEKAVILDIQLKIREWYQDCFFALQNGIPWRTRLGGYNQKERLDSDVINTIMSVEGVLSIESFTSQLYGRNYYAQVSVYTQYSTQPSDINIDTGNLF